MLVPSLARVIAIGLLTLSSGVAAEDTPEKDKHLGQKARWAVAPYVWVPTFTGTLGISGQTVDVDIRADELAGSVKVGGMGYVRRIAGRHMWFGEFLGADFEDDNFEQFRGLPVAARLIAVEAGYGYQFSPRLALPNGGVIVITPYVGLRHVRFEVQATSPLPLLVGDLEADERWLDPVLGVLVEGPITESIGYTVKIDGAGFGLGRDHYLSSAVYLARRLGDHWLLGLGYRHSRFDAEPGGDNALSIRLRGTGPAVGLAYVW